MADINRLDNGYLVGSGLDPKDNGNLLVRVPASALLGSVNLYIEEWFNKFSVATKDFNAIEDKLINHYFDNIQVDVEEAKNDTTDDFDYGEFKPGTIAESGVVTAPFGPSNRIDTLFEEEICHDKVYLARHYLMRYLEFKKYLENNSDKELEINIKAVSVKANSKEAEAEAVIK